MKNTKINLCDRCDYCIADCPEKNPVFCDGVGNDNVIECKTFDSQWISVEPLFKSLLGNEYKPLNKGGKS